MNKGHNVDNLI